MVSTRPNRPIGKYLICVGHWDDSEKNLTPLHVTPSITTASEQKLFGTFSSWVHEKLALYHLLWSSLGLQNSWLLYKFSLLTSQLGELLKDRSIILRTTDIKIEFLFTISYHIVTRMSDHLQLKPNSPKENYVKRKKQRSQDHKVQANTPVRVPEHLPGGTDSHVTVWSMYSPFSVLLCPLVVQISLDTLATTGWFLDSVSLDFFMDLIIASSPVQIKKSHWSLSTPWWKKYPTTWLKEKTTSKEK